MGSEMCKLSIECTQEQGEISAGDRRGMFDCTSEAHVILFLLYRIVCSSSLSVRDIQ